MKLVPLLLLAALSTNEPESDDAVRIQGTWKVVSATANGESTQEFVGSRLTFKRDTLICKFTNLPKDYPKEAAFIESKFKLGSTQSPKTLDWILDVEGKPFTSRSRIYSLAGESLSICANKSGDSRPTELKAEAGDDCILYVLKRVPADPTE